MKFKDVLKFVSPILIFSFILLVTPSSGTNPPVGWNRGGVSGPTIDKWDIRGWGQTDFSKDTAYYYQKLIFPYNNTPFAGCLWKTIRGAGYITEMQFLLNSGAAGMNNMLDSLSVEVYIDAEATPRINLPVPILAHFHWYYTGDADLYAASDSAARCNLMTTETFRQVCSLLDVTTYSMGARKIVIPYADSCRIYFVPRWVTAGFINCYAQISYTAVPREEIIDLGRFRYLNSSSISYYMNTDTVGDAGPNPSDKGLFSISGQGNGMLHEIIFAQRGVSTGYINVLEDSIYFTIDGRVPEGNFKSTSTDDFFSGYYYSKFHPQYYGDNVVGQAEYFRDISNNAYYVMYRYFHPFNPVPFTSTVGIGTKVEEFPIYDKWTIVLDADLITDNVLSCRVNGDLVSVTYAVSHLNTMNLMDDALTAHANIASVTVGGTGNRTLTIIGTNYINLEITEAQVTGGASQAGVVATEIPVRYEQKFWLFYYSQR